MEISSATLLRNNHPLHRTSYFSEEAKPIGSRTKILVEGNADRQAFGSAEKRIGDTAAGAVVNIDDICAGQH